MIRKPPLRHAGLNGKLVILSHGIAARLVRLLNNRAGGGRGGEAGQDTQPGWAAVWVSSSRQASARTASSLA